MPGSTRAAGGAAQGRQGDGVAATVRPVLWRLHAILTLLLVSPAAGQQPVRLIGAAFGGVAGAAERAGPRNEALASVQAVDAPELVSALVSAWGVVHSEARAVERERGRAAEQKLPSVSEMRERVELDACFGQMARIEALLAQAEGRARAELAEVVLGSRYPSQLRAILAPAVGGFGEVVRDAAAASLSDAKRPDDVWVALRVLQGLGGQARALGASIRPRLADREPMLRVQAARTLAAIGDRAAVPVLIDRLEQEDDRRRHAVVDALERLTKQSFGMLVGSWRAWWAAEGEAFLRNGPPKQPAKKPNPAAATPATTSAYFGIPQDGRAVLYLVDFSQSMRARMSGKQGPTRWQECLRELGQAFDGLGPDRTFNVVVFAQRVLSFRTRQVPADARNVAAAKEWLADLELELGTAIFEGFEVAYQLGGARIEDRYFEPEIDTIFFLSDGMPTVRRPESPRKLSADKPALTLSLMRRRDPFRTVVVHAVLLGKSGGAGFLRQLAQQGEGRFVQR